MGTLNRDPNGIRIARASPPDLDGIVALERASETAPHWPTESYAALLGLGGNEPEIHARRCLVVARTAGISGRIHGFAVGSVVPGIPENITAELETVVVAEESRRRGIGRALCLAILDWCCTQGANETHLEVRASGAAAIALYKSLGFQEAGRRPAYYRDPNDDAVLMRLVIR